MPRQSLPQPPPQNSDLPAAGPGVPTLRWRCAGSDLQSRSMCSPTTTSGISPRRTGTGVLHSGHTGTCTSCGHGRAAGAPGFGMWDFGMQGFGMRGFGGAAHLLVGGGALVLGVRDVVGAEDPLAGVALEGQEICGTQGRRSAPHLRHGPHPAAPRPALTAAAPPRATAEPRGPRPSPRRWQAAHEQ